MWLATQIAPFICGDTGSLRDLEFALWEVRLTVLMQLRHWKLRYNGAWTVPEQPPVSGEAISAALTRLRDKSPTVQL